MIQVKIDPVKHIAYVQSSQYTISAPVHFAMEKLAEARRQGVNQLDFLAKAVQTQIESNS